MMGNGEWILEIGDWRLEIGLVGVRSGALCDRVRCDTRSGCEEWEGVEGSDLCGNVGLWARYAPFLSLLPREDEHVFYSHYTTK